MTSTTMPTDVDGWRLFRVDVDRLVAPIVSVLFTEFAPPAWDPGLNVAACLNERPCRPPIGEHCTCGFRAVEDLGILLERAGVGTEECGALARVRLSGVIHEGVMIPEDDPPTTWRGSQAEVIEIHLSSRHETRAGRIKSRYDVPVAVYEPDEWPHGVRALDPFGPQREVSVEGFLESLCALSFGIAGSLADFVAAGDDPAAVSVLASLVDTGRDAAKAMAGGVPAPDIARQLYGTELDPSMEEATAFVEAVIVHLYPYNPRTVKRTQMYTSPPTFTDLLNRSIREATRIALPSFRIGL